MSDDEYVFCPDCKLRRYLKDTQAWDKKTAARKWVQTNCPRGVKRGCSTRLSNVAAIRKAQVEQARRLSQMSYAMKRAKKRG